MNTEGRELNPGYRKGDSHSGGGGRRGGGGKKRRPGRGFERADAKRGVDVEREDLQHATRPVHKRKPPPH